MLCEKPMTLDAATTADALRGGRERGLFLMEAMWMACHPMIRTLLALLAAGEHGTARQVHADLGFVVDADPDDRLLDPALGAGALLDMGIYPLTFAHLVLGEPERLAAVADLVGERHRPRRRDRRALRRRGDRGADRVDDLRTRPRTAIGGHRRSAASTCPTASTTRPGCGGRRTGRRRGVDHASGSSRTSRWSGGATATRSSRSTGACAPAR